VTDDTLIIERRQHVVSWTLNRPQAMNALNADLLRRLADAAEQAAADAEVRVVVIQGAGERAFCAGADLDELSGLSTVAAHEHLAGGQAVFRAIEQLGKPVIAAVDGYALGGGLELALACTLIVTATGAKLGLPEVRLGLIPGYGGTQRLPRAIGRQAALRMMLTGERIAAEEAYELGLTAQPPVEPERFAEAVEQLAEELAGNGPLAMRFVLQAVAAGADGDAALAYESTLAAAALSTDDAAEGVRAFREKRAPLFRAS
jgi:enoyl-CoA hydratase